MAEIEKIVRGALVGIAVYVTGPLRSKFLIEPLCELRKVVEEVRFKLPFMEALTAASVESSARRPPSSTIAGPHAARLFRPYPALKVCAVCAAIHRQQMQWMPRCIGWRLVGADRAMARLG